MLTLRKVNYYGDFFAYPVLMATVALPVLSAVHARSVVIWTFAAGAGVVAWTLVEYALHRFAFHNWSLLKIRHAEHHQAPRELLGAPTWLTVMAFGGLVFTPLALTSSWRIAQGATFGVMSGYLWYVTVHHVVHHWEPRRLWPAVAERRRYHNAHHYDRRCGNFGVTVSLWDRVFRTQIVREMAQRDA